MRTSKEIGQQIKQKEKIIILILQILPNESASINQRYLDMKMAVVKCRWKISTR